MPSDVAGERGPVTIIGTGQIGSSAALLFALHGRPVRLVSRTAESARRGVERIRGLLRPLIQSGITDAAAAGMALERIDPSADLQATIRGVRFIFEAIPEHLDLKRALFRQLDALTPPAVILASGTSGLLITQLAANTIHPGRIIGVHFWNPPHLMALVEVMRGERTSPHVVEETCALVRALGKSPVVEPDIPGGIGNRLQYAMIREAISLVDRGVASPADIDTVVKLGFGTRLAVIGPLELCDLIGLHLAHAILDYLLPDLDRSDRPPRMLAEKVQRGELGVSTEQGFHDWRGRDPAELRERIAAELIARHRRLYASGAPAGHTGDSRTGEP